MTRARLGVHQPMAKGFGVRNYNENHDDHGRFAEGPGGGAGSEPGAHTTPVRVPVSVSRSMGFDDPVTISEIATSGIHVTTQPGKTGDYIHASSRAAAQGFLGELHLRASSEWDQAAGTRAAFTKFAARLRTQWGL